MRSRFAALPIAVLSLTGLAFAATRTHTTHRNAPLHLAATHHVVARAAMGHAGRHHANFVLRGVGRRGIVHHYYGERFTASSFADNLTAGDVTEGEDPVVRAAAIQALGNMNGTVLAIDPSSGRILAMVNQKLALSSGAEP